MCLNIPATFSESSNFTNYGGKISDATRLLSLFPFAGKKEIELSEELKTDYRSVVVIKEIKLIYTVTYDEIFIEYIMNTRQSETTIANMLE